MLSDRPVRAALALLLAAGSTSLTGCAPSLPATAPKVLAVPLDRSPSGGSDLTFCANVPAGQPLQLDDLLWLSFFSANEYAHLRVVGPMLDALGFGLATEPMDRSWIECDDDLEAMRRAEKAREDEIEGALHTPRLREIAQSLVPPGATWGTCATRFLGSAELGDAVMPSAAFQDWLVHRPHEGRFVELFTGRRRGGSTFEDGSTQVMFARHSKQPIVVIAFRGTEPRESVDVVLDLRAWRTRLDDHGWPAGWGSVHSGFYDGFEEVEALLLAKLHELDGTGVKIWLTGHSLGGALATLTAARVLREIDAGADWKLGGLYTYGSPRVGDHAFKEALEARAAKRGVPLVRVRNADDAVTAIPGVVLGYEHVGMPVVVDEHGMQVAPKTEPPYGLLSVRDHDASGYHQGRPTSGYYRRLLQARDSGRFADLGRCDDPPRSTGAAAP